MTKNITREQAQALIFNCSEEALQEFDGFLCSYGNDYIKPIFKLIETVNTTRVRGYYYSETSWKYYLGLDIRIR